MCLRDNFDPTKGPSVIHIINQLMYGSISRYGSVLQLVEGVATPLIKPQTQYRSDAERHKDFKLQLCWYSDSSVGTVQLTTTMTVSSLASFEYLERLPGTTFRRLYQQPSTALAVFRRMLPHLG